MTVIVAAVPMAMSTVLVATVLMATVLMLMPRVFMIAVLMVVPVATMVVPFMPVAVPIGQVIVMFMRHIGQPSQPATSPHTRPTSQSVSISHVIAAIT